MFLVENAFHPFLDHALLLGYQFLVLCVFKVPLPLQFFYFEPHLVALNLVLEAEGLLSLFLRLQVLALELVHLAQVPLLQLSQLPPEFVPLGLYVVSVLVELLDPELPGFLLPLLLDLLLVDGDEGFEAFLLSAQPLLQLNPQLKSVLLPFLSELLGQGRLKVLLVASFDICDDSPDFCVFFLEEPPSFLVQVMISVVVNQLLFEARISLHR